LWKEKATKGRALDRSKKTRSRKRVGGGVAPGGRHYNPNGEDGEENMGGGGRGLVR